MLGYLKENLDTTADALCLCGLVLFIIGVFYLIYELLFTGVKFTPIDFISVGIGLVVLALAVNAKHA